MAIGALWREHVRADQDDRNQRDLAQRALAALAQGTKQMAAQWEEQLRVQT